jgi:hypothetical protein
MIKRIKPWSKSLAILMLFFAIAALVTQNVTAAFWLTGLFLIFGLVGLLITLYRARICSGLPTHQPLAQGKTGCDQVLPNGNTVGEVVRQQRAQLENFQSPATQCEAAGDPLPATTGVFIATVLSNGPIDF